MFQFDEEVSRRETHSIKWDSYDEDTIPLWIADMDFAAAPAITEAIIKRAEHPVYGYTRADQALFEAFKDWFYKTYDFKLEDSWLKLISGIVPGLAVASQVAPGKCITNTPNYSMLLSAPVRAGKEMIQVPLKQTEGYYEIDFEALQKKVTKDTSFFYLCNPHNPVGRVYTREELLQVSAFAKKNNLIIVSDEIHCELVYDRNHVPILSVDAYAREHSITFMGPGKVYNLPGVVSAFAIIPNPNLMKKFKEVGYALSDPGIFNIEASKAAYQKSQAWKEEMLAYLKENRDYLEKALKKRLPKALFTHCEGTYLMLIDFRAYGISDPAAYLKKEAKVILNDGEGFGAPGYVRLNFACRRATLVEALDRIERVLKVL